MENKNYSKFLYKEKIDYFKDKTNVEYKKKYSIRSEILSFILLTITLSYYITSVDLFESVFVWSKKYENFEVDEAFIIFILLVFISIIFAVRRFGDLKDEVAARKDSEKYIFKYALFDNLTGLPNRHVFYQNLEIAISRLGEINNKLAVILVDLDNFKVINDTFGHEVGDRVLEISAKRIAGALKNGDTISRLGGDEFNIIQANIRSSEEMIKLSELIMDTFEEIINIDGHNIFVSISIGMTICDNSKAKPNDLIREADIAMYSAKEIMSSSLDLYTKEMDEKFSIRQMIRQDLHEAIKNKEFELYYQPQFTIDNKLTGFEALLRWMSPKRGMVSPGIFIPIAEEYGLIEIIDEMVLEKACKTAVNWDKDLTIAVNISASQFKKNDFIQKVKNILESTGLDPKRLELEITEGVLITNSVSAKKNIFSIKDIGTKIVMDDFGTGYSSLSYLRELPFDKIKIDRSFIINLESEDKDLFIIKAIIDISKALKVSIIAEGVETIQQKDKLISVGCNHIQGFLFGRPKPLEETEKLIIENGFEIKTY